MLPFLKNKNNTGISMEYRKPDESSESDTEANEAMEAVAKDMIQAINSNDFKKLAKTLESAFQIFDSSPHEEYDHEKDDSFVD